jgi:putative ABC transport system permease protein
MRLGILSGVEQFIQDLRYGFRTFVRQPAFAVTAIVALALGIGANTAVFSVVYAVLLKPLPFAEPDRLIYLHDTYPAVPSASVSWPKFVALRDGNRTLGSMAAFAPGTLAITGRGEPQQIATQRVSGDFFTVFGVPPLAGRPLTRADDVENGGKVIVLSHGLWRRRFAGDLKIVGQAVTVNGEPYTVASVMPAAFNYPAGTEAWVPLALPAKPQTGNFLRVVGRMKPDVTMTQAFDDLRAVTAVFNQANQLQRDIKIYPLHDFLASRNRQMLMVLQGTVAFVLLIACANVANLLLARSVSRGRELSIRAAIGAGRGRLVRQLLTESVLLSLLGSIVGVLLASWLLRLFVTLAPANFAGVQAIRIDTQILLVTLGIAMATGVLFGLAPARHGFRVDPNDSLRDTGARGATSAGAKGASRALVVAEISLAMVLVIGAGVMLKSLMRLQSQDAGFKPDGVMTFQVNLPSSRYPTPDRIVAAVERVVSELRSMPGVSAAGAINMIPLLNFGMNGNFSIAGRPPFAQQDRAPIVEYRAVTTGYFAAMGIPMKRGAEFTGRETAATSPIVIINETMARQFWPDANPVGERVQLTWDPPNVTREIVAVAGDARSQSLSARPVLESYVPHAQSPFPGMGVVVRSQGIDPASILPAARQRIGAIDPDLPLIRPQTLAAVVDTSAGSTRLSSVLTSVFALLAALLASVGIYSLIAYSVAERTRELGIRVALGADRRAVVRLIVGEGLRLAAIGIVIGLIGSYLLTGTLQTMLFEVSPFDPAVLAMTSAAVLLVTVVASYVPARRALRVDPMTALRGE